ncbi:MAG: hypothetical protein RM368_33000 [Nostoc sp. DedSLP03]|uniref:hypothetical protein n=1 Tax=Nostoc sp. DedSLP03 TaxID=3075400 RepID=UPI002AD46451|nr:hypothetical protein [Nostoc sp. DedSLP03]MDZ7969709.1 hypothetical protein [Nostoc sp. DedSLP03]
MKDAIKTLVNTTVHQVLASEIPEVEDAIAIPLLNLIENYLLNMAAEMEESCLGDASSIIEGRLDAEITRFSKALNQTVATVGA